MKKLCECGCGEETKIGINSGLSNRFIDGHQNRGKNHPFFGIPRSEEQKQNQSKVMKGRKHTEEHKQKNREANSGENNPNFGKPMSEEQKKKISKGRKGKNTKPKFIGPLPLCACGCGEVVGISKQTRLPNRYILGHYSKCQTEEHKQKISKTLTGKYTGENNPFYGKQHTEESRKKSSATKQGILIEDWLGFISFEPYCPKFNTKFKEKIRDRDNYTCQNCGCKENGENHSVHHIHYDKENCYPDVITLCRSCNAKANGNRNKWEAYYMNKLNNRGLLYWTQQHVK